jgi:hypothetical protein
VRFRNRTLLLQTALLVLAAALFAGCLKSVENTPPKPQTYISILHMAPAGPAVDIYLNGKKSSSSAMPSGTYFIRYSPVDPGIYTIDFKKDGTDSIVASIPADIYDSLGYSTLLLYDQPGGNGVDALRIEDDFSQFNVDKAHIRFFHLSPGLMPVDLYFNDSKIASNRQYADNTFNPYNNQFVQHDPNYYTISVKKANSDSLITQTTVNLQAAQAYTIMLNGLPGQSGDKGLAIDVLTASN